MLTYQPRAKNRPSWSACFNMRTASSRVHPASPMPHLTTPVRARRRRHPRCYWAKKPIRRLTSLPRLAIPGASRPSPCGCKQGAVAAACVTVSQPTARSGAMPKANPRRSTPSRPRLAALSLGHHERNRGYAAPQPPAPPPAVTPPAVTRHLPEAARADGTKGGVI